MKSKISYKQISSQYKILYNKTIKTCWIADAKRSIGLPVKTSKNRIDKDSIQNPCPSEGIKEKIIDIIRNAQ